MACNKPFTVIIAANVAASHAALRSRNAAITERVINSNPLPLIRTKRVGLTATPNVF